MLVFFFFFKQKTAYELRISDWSSDVCSSDLIARAERNQVMAAPLMVGSTLPSHCTSMGRVLLAALDEEAREGWLAGALFEPRTEHTIVNTDALRTVLRAVADQRWGLVEEELELGLRSLAVPVRDRDGPILGIGRAAVRERGCNDG